ncbi:LOW QUALITY PROTEIN: broad substrate specificity ATP-binding cassette transporter ABCG2-like [Amphiura filiformis]|uniref:LOW QUALITY PROTEIN: broad substrate specificity ATP-binding cassette transporter ABCG2-like n=1 Tax=Amphiura filiformis TaxID=82378 RepID=UPI003B220F96
MDNAGYEKDSPVSNWILQPVMNTNPTAANGSRKTLSSSLSITGSTLSFHDIQYSVQVKQGKCGKVDKNILKDISGVFKPGMNAIMGPTGGGKTSLLDVLAHRKDPNGLSGKVLIDGKPQPSNFRLISGYVVQDDIVMGTLSVRENLTFSASLRLPSSVGTKEREQRVEDVISELGLQDCADTRIGGDFTRGVSGGERKRTNVGMELISKPKFLFLDEPTTGLDASTAGSVMFILAQLSQRGRTIIFSIHQPRYSVYRLFDKLHLLSKGSTVYHGPSSEALQYFAANGYICEEHDNPADFFLDSILHNQAAIADSSQNNDAQGTDVEKGKKYRKSRTEMKEYIPPLTDSFKKSRFYSDMTREVNSIMELSKCDDHVNVQRGTYQASFFRQFGYLGRRAFKNFIRNPKTSFGQIILACTYALFCGLIFWQLDDSATNAVQDRTGALFFLVMNTMMQNTAAVDAFISERKIFVHESVSGYYRTSAYFLAKILADLIPQRTIPTILYCSIVYWMIGLRPDGVSYLIFTLNLLLTTYASCGLFFFIGANTRSFFNAIALIAIVIIVHLMFSGFLINIQSIPGVLAWLEYLSVIRYSLKALTTLEFKDRLFCNDNSTAVMSCGPQCLQGNLFLDQQGIDYSYWGFWQNEMALGIIAIAFMIFSYLKLRFMKKFK